MEKREKRISLVMTMKLTLLVGFPIFFLILTFTFYNNLRLNRKEILAYMNLQKTEVARTTNAYLADFERRNFNSESVLNRYGEIIENKDSTEYFIRILKDAMSIGYATMRNVKWISIVENGNVHKHNTVNISDETILKMIEGMTSSASSLYGRGRFFRDPASGEVLYIRAIYGFREMKVLGYLLACIDTTAIVPYFSAIEKETGNHYAVQTYQGDLVYEYSSLKPNTKYETEYANIIDFDLVLRQDVDMAKQQAGFRESYYITVAITFCMLLIIFCFLSLFLNNIRKQIGSVLDRIHQISESRFESPANRSAQLKEIEEISENLDSMATRIDALIKEKATAERNRQKVEIELLQAKYAVLQSQVNPHFLYNALESIYGRSLMHQDKETASMICKLADFFRGVLDYTGKEWSISEEMDFIHNYLELYQAIYPERLSLRFDVDDDLLSYPIPSFLLQPIVENSIVHGLEQKIEPCQITVSCTRDNGSIIFYISDDGAGMDPTRLNEVREMLVATRKGRVGLPNVAERLKLAYGSRASFSIESEKGKGTTVVIEIKEMF